MTLFYIATGLPRAKDHNLVRDALIEHGHKITYDWTQHGCVKTSAISRLAEVAHHETSGVLAAEVIIVLLPGGYGTHTELGMALGAGKKIILHSADKEVFTACEKTNVFYHHENVLQLVCNLDDTSAFLEAIQKLSHRPEKQLNGFQTSTNEMMHA